MSNNILLSVAETLGPVAAAKRALGAKTWTPEAEAVFAAHWPELDAMFLLAWLSKESVGESPRPIAEVLERIVETSPHDAGAFTFLGYPEAVAAICDAEVRDAVVEMFRGRLDHTAWTRLTALACGGPVFTAVRDCELRCWDGKATPPIEAVVDGHAPCSLIALVFDQRRDDKKSLRLLGEQAGERQSRLYALWVLHQTRLLAQAGTPADILGDVPIRAECEDLEQLQLAETLMDFARSWPDEGALRTWLVERWVRAVERGVPWEDLWWEIDPELRDEVALRAVSRTPPAIVLNAMSRRWTDGDLWRRALPVLEAYEAHEEVDSRRFNHGLAVRDRRTKLTREEMEEALHAFGSRGVVAWLANTPLPQDADDELINGYVNAIRCMSPPGLFDYLLVDRLLALALTTSRAQVVLSLTLPQGRFWSLERCVEIAEAAVHVGVLTDVPLPLPLRGPALVAYKILVGEGEATRRLVGVLDAAINSGAIYEALGVADALPEVDERRRTHLRDLALKLPIASLADLATKCPWLVTQTDVVSEATREGRAWGWVERLPDYLRPVITARAVTIDDERIARSLLERLEAFGAERREILALVLERVCAFGGNAIEPGWLSKRLDTRSLWERDPGREIVLALLGDGDREGAEAFLRVCFETARGDKARALLPVIHTLLGERLVEIAERSMDEGAVKRAKAALTGLAHLSPGARLRSRVRALRRQSDEELGRLIDVVDELLRRPDGRDEPTLDAIHDALREVAFKSAGSTP